MPSKAERREAWNKAGKDVVVLHQMDRSRLCPNPSPFPLKFETYLRMANIEYISDFTEPMSTKHKTPWMTINGKDVADSQIGLEYLYKELGEEKDLSANLSPEQKAIARGIRIILEDHFYFAFVMERWVYGDLKYLKDKIFAPLPIPGFLQGFVFKRIKKQVLGQAKGQGMGRHTKDEIYEMGLQDLKAVSDLLGDKSYLMGSEPTEVDAVVFGFVVQLLYTLNEDHPWRKAVEGDLRNLKDHTLRIKEKYWQDWDECQWKKKQ